LQSGKNSLDGVSFFDTMTVNHVQDSNHPLFPGLRGRFSPDPEVLLLDVTVNGGSNSNLRSQSLLVRSERTHKLPTKPWMGPILTGVAATSSIYPSQTVTADDEQLDLDSIYDPELSRDPDPRSQRIRELTWEQLKEGQRVEFLDKGNQWYVSRIAKKFAKGTKQKLMIHYEGWSKKHDEVMEIDIFRERVRDYTGSAGTGKEGEEPDELWQGGPLESKPQGDKKKKE